MGDYANAQVSLLLLLQEKLFCDIARDKMSEAYIVSTVRTAGGKRRGSLSDWHPVDLAAAVLDESIKRAKIPGSTVDDVIMGCVSQVGEQSWNIARNAVLASGLPENTPATSVDRQCGSSQQAIHFAAQAIMSGTQDVVIAAGVESMSRVAMGSAGQWQKQFTAGSPSSRNLIEKYNGSFSQFVGAEMIAEKWDFSREDLDHYALNSHQRAIKATESNDFAAEILPLKVYHPETGKSRLHHVDEGIRFDATFESINGLDSITERGVISAANASQICDGASAVVIASAQAIKDHNLTPLARIHNLTVTAGDPVIMLEEPLFATEKALRRANMTIADIDLYEVNEAFAPVPLAWLKHLDADPAKLNIHGGAISLGHPLGGSGTKLMTTLVNALRHKGLKYGLQTMCEGGGMANVTIVEAL
jgi:acetyl-CoA C-acetyltransferase